MAAEIKSNTIASVEAFKGMAFDDHITVMVVGEKYSRYGDECERINHTITGDAFSVAKKIAELHSYNQFADVDRFEDLDEEYELVEHMFNAIIMSNGDGCDYIDMMLMK